MPHKHEKREKNYGADISTLIRMIEAGELQAGKKLKQADTTGMLPVYDHRLIIGYAKSAQAAQRLARQAHQGTPSGFQVVARRRDTSIIDLPEGWIYSIVKHY